MPNQGATVELVAEEHHDEAAPAQAQGELLVEDELLIEEVSIDGMCGVY
ncbi:MAG: mycofactocin precursor [Acidimicrobiales bacterium]|nr:mycofactocin precursor [Acidimicrobiales bacterium]MBO0886122.1 mycofactocin precursor [Acidimicrobiales bacterium]MBO0893686.1 mycofactocin precursor [Acidimicrobiales bacterium]